MHGQKCPKESGPFLGLLRSQTALSQDVHQTLRDSKMQTYHSSGAKEKSPKRKKCVGLPFTSPHPKTKSQLFGPQKSCSIRYLTQHRLNYKQKYFRHHYYCKGRPMLVYIRPPKKVPCGCLSTENFTLKKRANFFSWTFPRNKKCI